MTYVNYLIYKKKDTQRKKFVIKEIIHKKEEYFFFLLLEFSCPFKCLRHLLVAKTGVGGFL